MIKPWWVLQLRPGRAVRASHLFKWTHVRGGEAKTFRRLLRVGPWGVYVIRYGPEGDA